MPDNQRPLLHEDVFVLGVSNSKACWIMYTTIMIPYYHRTVSERVAKRLGLAYTTARILGQTAQWPDWYRWHTTVPHAQTSDVRGVPRDPHKAAEDCSALLRYYRKKILTAAPNEQLVWLGFAVHLVQDLAAHEGRTDPEHAFHAVLFWQNPDYLPSRIQAGGQFTERLLQRVLAEVDATTLRRWTTGKTLRLLTQQEAQALLGARDFRTWILFGLAIRCVHYLFSRDPNKRVRWDAERVLERGLQEKGVQYSEKWRAADP